MDFVSADDRCVRVCFNGPKETRLTDDDLRISFTAKTFAQPKSTRIEKTKYGYFTVVPLLQRVLKDPREPDSAEMFSPRAWTTFRRALYIPTLRSARIENYRRKALVKRNCRSAPCHSVRIAGLRQLDGRRRAELKLVLPYSHHS